MTLFSYVVRWDHGFAPNPFYKMCTLATCKPDIRSHAEEGDWVLGTGGSERKRGGDAVFLMRVGKIITFDDYWNDAAFQCKRPVMNGSLKQRFGDNIYHRNAKGVWLQADSRHSTLTGANDENLQNDTGRTSNILIGNEYIYWGDKAPTIPKTLRQFAIGRRGTEKRYKASEIEDLVAWAKSFGVSGEIGRPIEWDWRYRRRWR